GVQTCALPIFAQHGQSRCRAVAGALGEGSRDAGGSERGGAQQAELEKIAASRVDAAVDDAGHGRSCLAAVSARTADTPASAAPCRTAGRITPRMCRVS